MATGELQSKPTPAALQVVTASKLAPKPYSSTIVCALALPLLRHCSPSKARVIEPMSAPVALVAPKAIQPATLPLPGLPK